MPVTLTVIGQPDGFNSGKPNHGGSDPDGYSFQIPTAAAVVNSTAEIWVADTGNNRVIALPATGNQLYTAPAAKLLGQLANRLEERELTIHILASYEIRPIATDFCPPVHLQQLRKALVSREESKRVEELLKQVPAKRLSMKPLEELAKRIRRYSRWLTGCCCDPCHSLKRIGSSSFR